jgi:hypothetical protein
MKTARGWSREFDDPIPLKDGRQLATLEEAARHIQRLPKTEHDLDHWQLAGTVLIAAAEGRDFLMHARIAMLRALNHGKPAPAPERKKLVKKYRIVR